jgi:hypothetical protein
MAITKQNQECVNPSATKKSHPEAASPRTENANLCDKCREIDFALLWDAAGDWPNERPTFPLERSDGCGLCEVLLPDYQCGETVELSSIDPDRISSWQCRAGYDVPRSARLRVKREHDYREDTMFYAPPGYLDANPGLWKPRVLPERPDYGEACAWLANCVTYHGSECNEVGSLNVENMYLVDCENARIVRVDEIDNPRWLALSYVWGAASQALSSAMADNDLSVEKLPQTIQDAITVTRALDYRYLWVDELCINQRNAIHRTDQIVKMDQIYKGADLTIVAAAGDNKHHGLPGVSKASRTTCLNYRCHDGGVIFDTGPDPLEVVQQSTWFRRAWTFQEGVLSRRLLVFTDHQMAFYCDKASWMEALGGPQHMASQDIDWDKRWHVRLSLWGPRYKHLAEKQKSIRWHKFRDFIQDYTSRQLSFDADVLTAASGVLNHLRMHDGEVLNLSGLPYYSGLSNTVWNTHMVSIALSWHHDNHQPETMSRRAGFPSWTWAGWRGKMLWMTQSWFVRGTSKSHLRSVEMWNETTRLEPPPNRLDLQPALDSVTDLVIEVPLVDPALFTAKDPTATKKGATPVYFSWNYEIANRPIDERIAPSGAMLDEVVANLRTGMWTCLLLSEEEVQKHLQRFFLIVRWENHEIASRVAGIVLVSTLKEEERLGRFDSDLEIRKIRLI